MDNLKQIVEVLTANIEKSNVPIPISLQNAISSLSSNSFNPLVAISHKRYHKKLQFNLKYCDKKHCIECLLGLSKCEHDKSITKYECAQIKFLSQKLYENNFKMQGERFCKACKTSDSPLNFAFKPCFCECIKCINKRITNGNSTCGICSTEYHMLYIESLYWRLNLHFPGLRKICSGCHLPLCLEGFNLNQCFVCDKIAKFL